MEMLTSKYPRYHVVTQHRPFALSNSLPTSLAKLKDNAETSGPSNLIVG